MAADKFTIPFPGMYPYLEVPDIWPDFHDALAAAIRADLNISLPAPYYARLQKRPELGVILEAGVSHRIIPDVTVLRRPPSIRESGPTWKTGPVVLDQPRTEASAGIEVRVHTDPFQHRFVEVRDAEHGHKLITLIEIVSPSNKQPGPDRRAYEAKQEEVLAGQDPDILLDLQVAANRVYREGPYARAIDYSIDPDPPLNEEDTAWINERLRVAGWRS